MDEKTAEFIRLCDAALSEAAHIHALLKNDTARADKFAFVLQNLHGVRTLAVKGLLGPGDATVSTIRRTLDEFGYDREPVFDAARNLERFYRNNW